MDQELKQRLIGASVIIALAIIFVPMLFDGDGVKQQNQNISIEIPDSPGDLEVKTFEIDKPVTDQQMAIPSSDVSLSQQATENDKGKPIKHQPVLIDRADDEQKSDNLASQQTVQSDNDNSKPIVNVSNTTTTKSADIPAKTTQNVAKKEAGSEKQDPDSVSQAQAQIPSQKPVQILGNAYRVKLGSFSKEANAQKVKAQLLQKKITTMVEKDATRNLYHVWSAQLYQKQSTAQQYVAAVVSQKLNLGTPTIQSVNATQVDALAQQGQLGWVVQLGSFSAKDNAIELRNKVKAAGFNGFVDQVKNSKGENRFRLRVGPLMEKKDAEKSQSEINARLKINGLIKTHDPGLPVVS